ncbi:hypothetical protein GJAV_G00108660 [Gymnothorax javanicus]|nr:hypothetical protein GJAV_G00108660 [Gymnothorax javanicus]
MVGDPPVPAPVATVEAGLRRTPERGLHLGNLPQEEPSGWLPAESQPAISEKTEFGSLPAEEEASEISTEDSEMQKAEGSKEQTPGTKAADHGTRAADGAATLGPTAADHAMHDPLAPFEHPSAVETSGRESWLSSAERAGLSQTSAPEEGWREAYLAKTPSLASPDRPTEPLAPETAELGPFPAGPELKPVAVGGDAQTPSTEALEAHLPLTPNTYPGPTTTVISLPQLSPNQGQREPTPSQGLGTEQEVLDITSVSAAAFQNGGLEKEDEARFADSEAGPMPLSDRSWMSVTPLDHTVSEDMDRAGTLFPGHLPLLFDPADDADPEAVVSTPPGGSTMTLQPSGAMQSSDEEELVDVTTADADHTISDESLPGPSDSLSSPWQMSGSEIPEAVSTAVLLSTTAPPAGLPQEQQDSEEHGATEMATETHPILSTVPPSSDAGATLLTTVAGTAGLPLPKPKSGLEQLEYEEEHDEDEDEEDEDTEDSEEDESHEEESEAPPHPLTPPTFSHVPRPHLWAQRHYSLMRGWVEKIRDEAGYASGMLAPVGIGIAGALVILGILYSARAAHRKRRNHIKQRRRKQSQMTTRQDQAMLLADSSEDEL